MYSMTLISFEKLTKVTIHPNYLLMNNIKKTYITDTLILSIKKSIKTKKSTSLQIYLYKKTLHENPLKITLPENGYDHHASQPGIHET